MTDLSREDKIDSLLQKQVDILNKLSEIGNTCTCEARCAWHVFGKLEIQLSTLLLEKEREYFLKEQDVRVYVSDVAGMMSGFKKFVHKKIDEKVKRENLQPVPITRRAIDDIG
jgi:hypothetical protein|tara:strand:- start:702 stop:1040 length:339 start_codon:yes stop_codon:yes gene_type:complete